MKKLHNVLDQRCLLLFWALVGLLIALPFVGGSVHGQVILVIINIAVLLTAVAAVGRTRLAFLVAVMLVLPALFFRLIGFRSNQAVHFALAYGFNAAFYAFVLVSLMRYVFRIDTMSGDKLFGAVAAYILIALFWAQLHALTQYFYPGAYALHSEPQVLGIADLIYFSFTALTTAGFGDISPVLVQSRYLTLLEMVVGVMFVAILIARLTGVYPVVDRRS